MFTISRSARLYAIALTLAWAAGCSSKQDSVVPNTEISWSADGASVKATSASGQSANGLLGFSGTYANTSSGSFSSVTFSNLPKATGTYSLASTNSPTAIGAQGSYISNGDTYAATSGNVVITNIGESTFSGTFSFTAKILSGTTTKVISNGKFDVAY